MYTHKEEKINIASHALGLLLSVIALTLLVAHAREFDDGWHKFSFVVFGTSLVVLYTASTWYHSTAEPQRRQRLRVLDHASIYVLIAGTYTPFALITLDGALGNAVFALTWGLAACGIGLKLFFTGSYKRLSTLMYVAMGWLMVLFIGPLRDNLSNEGLLWLGAGGIAYTVGAVLYGLKAIKYSHAVFHLFVLLGSMCHFVCIYYYVLPVS